MSSPQPHRDPGTNAEPFSAAQRRVLLVLLGVFIAWVGYQLWSNPSAVPDPAPSKAIRYLELQDRIDPNQATEADFAALPELGPARAADIVAYRVEFLNKNPGQIAFRSIQDLLRIKGIGENTVRQVEPFLMFPAKPDTASEKND